jgi:methyl-accepting chemotaxis protein
MRWSVGTKIAAGFALALVILAAIGITAHQTTDRLIEAADQRQRSYLTIQQLQELSLLMSDAQRVERGYLLAGDERFLEPYNEAISGIARELSDVRRTTVDHPNHQRRLDALEPLITKAVEVWRNNIEVRRRQGLAAAAHEVQAGQGKKLMDEIRQQTREMQKEETALLQVRAAATSERARLAQSVIVYGTFAAFVLMTIAAWLITQNISGPLKSISSVAERLAVGNMSVALVASDRSDEVGALTTAFSRMIGSLQEMAAVAQQIAAGDLRMKVVPQCQDDVLGSAFASMLENLRRMTRELSEGVSVLASSASEIMAAMTQVASASSETAAAVTETTATVEEVKQTIEVSTDKARSVSEAAQQASQISQDGRKAVDDSIEAMHRIHENMESIAESIVRLSEQSQAIGEIISTVNDLSEQSNLLAVNAAIEAAKAGEHGKGFAVVAQEVKSLAEQSKQATAQVRTILGDIQKATSGAVMATEHGSKAVATGMQLSNEVGESIRLVAEGIDSAARAASQIAASAQQQSVGMDQVALAMQNINRASLQNVVSTRQTEGAAKNLHELGAKLKQLVGQFQT